MSRSITNGDMQTEKHTGNLAGKHLSLLLLFLMCLPDYTKEKVKWGEVEVKSLKSPWYS
ncbi:hypothetical protein Hanom_Chr12g01086291 [Helianthus anomalus]